MSIINKHDAYITELINKISSQYDSVSTNVHFKISKKSEAEIDVCAVRGKKLDIFEVKCSYRIAKAKQQLRRAKRCLNATGNTYFYCGSSGKLQLIEV